MKDDGKFDRMFERIMDNGSGSASVIRSPIFDLYFETSEATDGVTNPLAVLAVHHGILSHMEMGMLPPDYEADRMRKMYKTIQKALTEYSKTQNKWKCY
jgi:hypothetical protein